MSLTNFTNSYVISNRSNVAATSYSNITPLDSGNLWWLSAANSSGGSSNSEATDYYPATGVTPSTAPPSSFLDALNADLAIAKNNNSCPQLTVLIHGLGNLFSTSISELATVIDGFQTNASVYGGLVISFDWPSYNVLDSGLNYSTSPYAFPAAATPGSIRGNISCTVPAFTNLLTMLQTISQTGFQINFVCHSEGNYMLMVGMNAQNGSRFINQVLLAAADINNAAFETPNGTSPTYTGQASQIAALSNQVTVYYSSGDDVLPISEGTYAGPTFPYHNPSYPGRLGLEGPSGFLELPQNVVAVDCATVINDTVAHSFNPNLDSHSSYFSIPQVLQDWSQTLTGVAAANVVNRTGSVNSFAMNYVSQNDTMVARAARSMAQSASS